ncbi:L-fucose:H+ symporter permease [Flavitalea antarctica]
MNKKNLALVLIICLFFLWGLAHNLNPILIPHLKKACQLTDLQSAFIDSAFFIGYFTMALPAGLVTKRFGYKKGILFGLVLFAGGALLFVPAANARIFGLFLFALFIIASGLTFLETAANPYIVVLGEEKTAAFRLNLAQSFNGLAATLAPLIGGLFILSGNSLEQAQLAELSSIQSDAYFDQEAANVKLPYIVISIIVLIVALIIWRVPLPEFKNESSVKQKISTSIWKQGNLITGVVAQFFYVGAQVCVSSFFIRFLNKTAAIGEQSAAFYLSLALFFFMIGRFAGTFIMRFIPPERLLFVYTLINMLLLSLAISFNGMPAVYCLIGVQFFMSIMFPTIFSLSIRGLGEQVKLGSSLLIMAIAGGAVLPVIMGSLSDVKGIQAAYVVPAIAFLPVLYFSIRTIKFKKKESGDYDTVLLHV